ncbi:hypothetical protein AA0112_g5650 [Alternaria arborescens]|nr:hypothetical protein AA0112_g5650 [Alternaria arborescens]
MEDSLASSIGRAFFQQCSGTGDDGSVKITAPTGTFHDIEFKRLHRV